MGNQLAMIVLALVALMTTPAFSARKVATPTFSPGAGNYSSAQTVTISDTTSGATIYYTTDGSTPTTSSTTYSSPITVSTSETVKALGVKSGYTNSAIGSAAYTITLMVATPTFSPGAGNYSSAQTVTISDTTSGATIYYTTDGSTPTTSSTTYSSSITVSTSETVKALGVKSGYTNSAIGSAAYTIGPVQTWYVRPDGGTRYSTNVTTGQCNGMYDAAYPGSGVNQNCAFNDARMLYQDGSYTVGDTFPGWGWVGAGGDTYIIRGSIGTGVSYRIGYNDPSTYCGSTGCWGIAGDPYSSGMPAPPSGTATQHTRVLGENYAACTSQSAKTQLHGGYGAGAVLNLSGTSYVDVACLDITDFSSCGRSGQLDACNTSPPLSDYATNGIVTSLNTTNTTISNVYIHGISNNGMGGATGDGVSLTKVTLSGNAGAGWNMDPGDGTTGSGHLTSSYFNTIFSGCAEVYPVSTTVNVGVTGGSTIAVGAVGDCTDDGGSGGYGDGVGTATATSNPAWIMAVDHSTAAYNTQDGFDLLHLQGGGSTLTITDSLAYGNEGQQLKMGAAGTAINNVFVGNCNALRQSIPGLPSGYNSRLSDFCRASDTAIFMAVVNGSTTKYLFNTLYSANSVALEIGLNGTCTTTCYLQYENNIMRGFTNDTANGYPSGGTGNNPAPIYFDSSVPFGNSGSSNSNNATFGQKASIPCPNTSYGELNAVCSDPQLADETFHLYGYGNMAPANEASPVVGAGVTITGITTDYKGATRANPPTIGACETTATCP
jgi:hypothetical protein